MVKYISKRSQGFTLVEMIVSLGIFTIALFISTSSFLAVVNADRKARATRIASDNLNLTLEDMSRKIKTGTTYNCGGGSVGVSDCSIINSQTQALAVTDQEGNRIVYLYGQGASCGPEYAAAQGCILRSEDGGNTYMPATSPEINITNLMFLVIGSAVWPDKTQPTVVVTIKGSLGSQVSTRVAFNIQTTITQRAYDH